MGRGLSFILLLIALPAAAQIYRYTDAAGLTAYSNQPPDGVEARPVELPPLNSVERQIPHAPLDDTHSRAPSRSAYEVLELTGLPVTGEVFTYLDAQGNRVYTDQPSASNASRVPLATSNRMPANPTGAAPVIAGKTTTKPPRHYDMLRILVPEPDATLRSNAGEMIVSVTSEPGLLPGHRYRLLLDGQPVAEPARSPVFALTHIDRGTHNLSIEILDEQGRTVERTANQPFHMLRISLSHKRQVKPCALSDYGQRPECPLKDKPAEEKNPFLRLF